MNKLFIFVIFVSHMLYAQNITCTFLGIVPGGLPEFEKGFETELREQLTTLPSVTMTDFNDIEYLKHKTKFFESPQISKKFIESLFQISTNNKTLVIWYRINSFFIKPKRTWIFGAKLIGSLSVTMGIYSLEFQDIMYLGDIKSQTSHKHPPVFFTPIHKGVSINARDRITLFTDLEKEIAKQSLLIVNSFARNIQEKTGILPEKNIQEQKIPSISDLFDIPSVAPSNVQITPNNSPEIEEENIKKDSSEQQ